MSNSEKILNQENKGTVNTSKTKDSLTGKVIKGVGGVFDVLTEQGRFVCMARGKLRKEGILAGDNVLISSDGRGYAVEKIFERKNSFIRPPLSNLDMLIIVIAPVPKPDYLLVEKLIVYCVKNKVEPVILVNKCDIDCNVYEKCYNDFKDKVKVIKSAALCGKGIKQIKSLIKGKTVCFAGQSAVGKSSLINALLPESNLKTASISKKTERGKHTTRHVELFRFDGGFIADTCGFSVLELFDIGVNEVAKIFFGECGCKFSDCLHKDEPYCCVREMVQNGEISKERYERYLKIIENLNGSSNKNERS